MKKFVKLIKATSAGHFLLPLGIDKVHEVIAEAGDGYQIGDLPEDLRAYSSWDKSRFEVCGLCPCNIKTCIKHRLQS
jgi:hypothetical protein